MKKTTSRSAKPSGKAKPTASPTKPLAKAKVSRPARPTPSSPAPRLTVKTPSTKATTKSALPAAKAKPTPAKPEAKASAKTTSNGAGKHINGSANKAPATPSKTSTPPASKPAKVDSPKTPLIPPRVDPVIPPEKDLTTRNKSNITRDRIVMMVPDPYWLHVYWELTQQSVFRAEAALAADWHGSKPILRLYDVTSTDTTSTSEAILRDINIHGGCNHWYIDIPQPPRSYRVDVGYLSKRGQFYCLARSNVVMPPKAGATEVLDESWAADIDSPATADRILAMSNGFEQGASSNSQLKDLLDEQFRRPSKEGQFGAGAAPGKLKKFSFDINAELVVYGTTDPTATVTLQNEPVKLRPDGTFTMRFSLPDSRQIIPAVATSADGLEEQTIVLAVERNIKRLDPMVHDLYGEQ